MIFEGKTTNEAIEKGLRELKISKNAADIKILDNDDKRSFFSILSPRVVKVEITKKEIKSEEKIEEKVIHKEKDINSEIIEQGKNQLVQFITEFLEKLNINVKYDAEIIDDVIKITFSGTELSFLIGYRGEVLNSFQKICTTIASRGLEGKIKVYLDIGGFRQKREKTLEDLAVKVSKTVIKTGKSVTLEPMLPYERKIIHSKLQNNSKITTSSIGEEPNRKVVISLRK